MAQPSRNPKSMQAMTLLVEEDMTALDMMADSEGQSRSEFLRELIRREIRRRKVTVPRMELPGQEPLFEEES